MELTQDLPPQYEERMLAAKLDCDRGNGQGDACHAVGEFLSVVKNDHVGARKQFDRNCKTATARRASLLVDCCWAARAVLLMRKAANAF